jgi:hypothetical protein
MTGYGMVAWIIHAWAVGAFSSVLEGNVSVYGVSSATMARSKVVLVTRRC